MTNLSISAFKPVCLCKFLFFSLLILCADSSRANELFPIVKHSFRQNVSVQSDQITMLGTNLLAVNSSTSAASIADGNRVVFDDQYSDGFDGYDAIKFFNEGENFGLLRNNRILSVEARSSVKPVDTLFYNMTGMRIMQYRLMFVPMNMNAADVKAELIDKYLNSRTTVDMMQTSYLDFNITTDAASNAPDRFMLVFTSKAAGPVPVAFTSFTANRNRYGQVDVSWKTSNEVNIQRYELERSANGRLFDIINTNIATANSRSSASYHYQDETSLQGVSFYRMKAVSENGKEDYSNIVKVAGANAASSVSVYPNPAIGGRVQISFTNKPAGNYNIQLINNMGQVLYSSRTTTPSTNCVTTINLNPRVIAGIYQLRIVSEEGESEVMKVQIVK